MQFNSQNKILAICDAGSLGDTITMLPALKKMTEHNYIEKICVNSNYVELFKLVLPNDLVLDVNTVTTVIPRDKITPDIPKEVIDPTTGEARFLSYPIKPTTLVRRSMTIESSINMHGELIDSFSIALGNFILKPEDKHYPKPQNLPPNLVDSKKYVVLAYGAISPIRRMLPEVFQDIKQHLLNKGYDVVLIGKSDHRVRYQLSPEMQPTNFNGIDAEGCIDLIDKISLIESLAIINDADAIIGVDGGLLHLAGMTDTKIIAGYTSVDPYWRLPYRDGVKGKDCFVVEQTSTCQYCQNSYMMFGIDFSLCQNKENPSACVNALTTDKWITQIDKALS